jgi:integrase
MATGDGRNGDGRRQQVLKSDLSVSGFEVKMDQLATTGSNDDAHGVMTAIAGAELAESSKKKYRRVVAAYLKAGHRLTDAVALSAWAAGLSGSGRAHLKAAVKIWTKAVILDVKGRATPENANYVLAGIYRSEALQEAIQAPQAKGQKAHIWLSQAEVKRLLAQPGADTIGQRDRLALALLAGAGVRREEAVNLTFDDVLLQPSKGKIRAVLQVMGKGEKQRVVPISDRLAAEIDAWCAIVGGKSYILRSVKQNGVIGKRLSSVGLFNLVRKYGRLLGRPDLAPHDLRRTYAQIGYESGVPITQISTLLGHSSVTTTQRYLNLALDLETTISDFVVW